MRERWNAARRALRGNRGSGIVLVLVCMLCVSILGVTVLYLSYTGLLIKVTERQSKEDFYDASAAVDEIRAGLQTAVSDSIASAYKTVLINYSNPGFTAGGDMAGKFQEEFRGALYGWKTESGDALFQSGHGYYNPSVLGSFVSRGDTRVSVRDGKAAAVVYDAAEKAILLKNLQVTYENARTGYSTVVNTDLAVGMPEFSYVLSQYNISGLPEFAVIAREELHQDFGQTQLEIDGSAYAGAISLKNAGSTLEIKKGTMVCRGLAAVQDAGISGVPRLTVDHTASLWANRIEVGTGSSLSLQGDAYVQDDLELAGNNSSAVLSGRYFGFGDSFAKAEESSAILVNGRGTTLDLSGVSYLMLAGHSFVSNYRALSGGDTATDVLMGESVSVRGNQRAYLAPEKCLVGVSSNPLIYRAGEEPAVTLDTAKPLWSGSTATLADYGASVKKVHTNYPGAVGETVVYYFLEFGAAGGRSGEENANLYFRDYFSKSAGEIAGYLNSYTTLSSVTGRTQSTGYTIGKAADGTYSLEGYVSPESIGNSAANLHTNFRRLTTTLFGQSGGDETMNPYDYLIRADELSRLPVGRSEFRDDAGNLVGVIVRGSDADESAGSYTLKNEPDTLRIVIATGSVTVEQEFNGLIISGEDIDMRKSVYARAADVTAAFSGTCAVGGETFLLGSFLRPGVTGNTGDAGAVGGSGWNLDKLVTYRHWSKN